jgi:hypothetical protein
VAVCPGDASWGWLVGVAVADAPGAVSLPPPAVRMITAATAIAAAIPRNVTL